MTVVFGRRLKDLRTQKHMTQSDIGDYLHVSKVSVSGYENGTREPDQESTKRLADLFNVSVDYLYGRNQTPKWATKKDTLELRNFIDQNSEGGMTFDGDDLTKEEKEKVEIAMTQIFWEKLKRIKERERRDTNDKH